MKLCLYSVSGIDVAPFREGVESMYLYENMISFAMSRPLRIEFPGAWYHVMNRGAGYQNIFRDDSHRALFMDFLSEIDRMFRVETHIFLFDG